MSTRDNAPPPDDWRPEPHRCPTCGVTANLPPTEPILQPECSEPLNGNEARP